MRPRQGSKTEYFQNCRKQSTPVTLIAATDPVTGKSEFRYRNNNTPPVIRVQPGSVLNVEYKNELAPQSKEDCFGHPCMQMTNLHFHGLHVSPNAPQDDVLDMMASPGETLHYSCRSRRNNLRDSTGITLTRTVRVTFKIWMECQEPSSLKESSVTCPR